MKIFELNGNWDLNQKGKTDTIKAAVPGCVHTALLKAKLIEDPFYRDNEDAALWVGNSDWIYSRKFRLGPEMLDADRLVLQCQCLDTIAVVKINGRKVAAVDNMFVGWEFDVKPFVKAGENEISIHFTSAVKHAAKQARKYDRDIHEWGLGVYKIKNGNLLRKKQCSFGWDWGPKLVTAGIKRDIRIVAFSQARIDDILITQDHSKSNAVSLGVKVTAVKTGRAKISAKLSVIYNKKTVATEICRFKGSSASADLRIKNPKLWWPNGMGSQPLYDVKVELIADDREILDRDEKRVGLRTLTLETKDDKTGQSFQFVANGKAFFAKGANWIPADAFTTRVTDQKYRYLLESAVDANMNMLRVWGGGIYENDVFYELCDELGICIWQDFMFACATYPAFDEQFRKSVEAEAVHNIKRLRHHASIAMWCGNNELEQGLVADEWDDCHMSWNDYNKIFENLIAKLVKKHDPQRRYWPSSPHSSKGSKIDFNSPDSGDSHLWDVWHGCKPFSWFDTANHRFVSEFGFQSFPSQKTVKQYTRPADCNVTSYIMEYHQRCNIGNTNIISYMLDHFRLPKNFEMTLNLSQILQAMGIKSAVEHFMRIAPRCMGTLYWQLNDCWPVASWSSIDYFGRFKALHHLAKNFYAPQLVSVKYNEDKQTAEIFTSNDTQKPLAGRVTWKLTDLAGKNIAGETTNVKAGSMKSKKCKKLSLADHVNKYGRRNLLLWVNLSKGKEVISRNMIALAKPKHLELVDPQIKAKVRKGTDNSFVITLNAKHPCLYTWLELNAIDCKLSDNYFHLESSVPMEITAHPSKPLSVEQFKKKLKTNSLFDTYV